MDEQWADTGIWVGDELRREAFFFESEGVQLYGSIYAPAEREAAHAVAFCNSWGYEGNQSDKTIQRIALATARCGGAGLAFHYAGFGDSEGEIAEASLGTLASAAVDAVAEGARRLPEASWTLAGLMLGASVATLATTRIAVDRLLLIQPNLRPSQYFGRLERSARRAAQRVPARAGNAYGYPLPRRIIEIRERADTEVARALEAFRGNGAVVAYAEPTTDELVPERFERRVLPGAWRFGARQKPELAIAVADLLSDAPLGISL